MGSSWHYRAVCLGCGWHTHAPFGDLFHVNADCCPRCGNEKPRWSSRSKRWDVRRSRWVSTSEMWKPSTWFSGRREWHPDDVPAAEDTDAT